MSRKTNVLFVTHADKKGGAEQSMIHLMNHIDTNQYEIFLICPYNAAYIKEIRIPHSVFYLQLGSLKNKLGFAYFHAVYRIFRIIKKHQIDIAHANGWRAPWFFVLISLITKTKVIWHHRDIMPSNMHNHWLPRFMDHVICISEAVKNSLDQKMEHKYSVIYNGIDFYADHQLENKRSFKQDDQFVIGHAGRIVEWKRIHYIMKAVALFNRKIGYGNWLFLIAGDDSINGSSSYFQQLIEMSKSLQIENHVRFLGHVDRPLEMMRDCDLTINFSDNEPFGRVIIESLAVHTPVIVADSGGAPEIIRLTGGGKICEDGNIDQLAELIVEFYQMSAHEHKQISQEGYEQVKRYFNMQTLGHEVSEVYQNLLHKHKQLEKGRGVGV